jgi:hypothetical protein
MPMEVLKQVQDDELWMVHWRTYPNPLVLSLSKGFSGDYLIFPSPSREKGSGCPPYTGFPVAKHATYYSPFSIET